MVQARLSIWRRAVRGTGAQSRFRAPSLPFLYVADIINYEGIHPVKGWSIMKERRYMEDWKNVTQIDEATGKEKRLPVYQGAWYRLGERGPAPSGLLALAAGLWAAFIVLLLLYFYLNFPGATTLYVFLPAACSLFPALYWALGVFGIVRAPEKMTRLQKENGIGRVLRSSAGCAVFVSVSVLCDAVFLFVGGQGQREWPGMLLLCFAAAAAWTATRQFRTIHNDLIEWRDSNP